MAGEAIINYLLLISLTGLFTTVTGQNLTTEAGNMTTTSLTTEGMNTTMEATTTLVVTTTVEPVTPPNIPTFEAREAGGEKVCMLIALDATVKFEDIESEVPGDANILQSPSECPEGSQTSFMELGWMDQDREFTLYLSFEIMENEYTMVLVNSSVTSDEGNQTVISEWKEEGTLIPKTPVGEAIHCSDVTMSSIEFRQYQFQPFAQHSGGEFGEVMECSDDSGLSTMWIIIICVVCGVGLIAVIGGVVCCMKRRRSTYESV